MPRTMLVPRGKRLNRPAAAVSAAINNVLLERGKKLHKPTGGGPRIIMLRSIPSFVQIESPRSGVGVKNVCGPKNNKAIKIRKLLVEPKEVEIKKNGVVLRKIMVRRKTYFPGRCPRVY